MPNLIKICAVVWISIADTHIYIDFYILDLSFFQLDAIVDILGVPSEIVSHRDLTKRIFLFGEKSNSKSSRPHSSNPRRKSVGQVPMLQNFFTLSFNYVRKRQECLYRTCLYK
jgi:hypothetical protein